METVLEGEEEWAVPGDLPRAYRMTPILRPRPPTDLSVSDVTACHPHSRLRFLEKLWSLANHSPLDWRPGLRFEGLDSE